MRAAQKPVIVKPGTSAAVSARQIALTTNRKRPSVTSVSGSVSSTRIGRMMALTNPSSTPAISADTQPDTCSPGTM